MFKDRRENIHFNEKVEKKKKLGSIEGVILI